MDAEKILTAIADVKRMTRYHLYNRFEDCGCLVGTLAMKAGVSTDVLSTLDYDANRARMSEDEWANLKRSLNETLEREYGISLEAKVRLIRLNDSTHHKNDDDLEEHADAVRLALSLELGIA